MQGLLSAPRLLRGAMIFSGILFLVVLYRTAWLSDDAYITYRCIDNFVNGFGLTFNPAQRVQAFTHPLWALLHIPFRWLFDNMYAVGLFISMGTSIAAVGLLVFRLQADWSSITVLLSMICSTAFMDFSTSGLENPMTHLLLCLFIWIYKPWKNDHQISFLSATLIVGLMLFNRMDTVLLVGPALLWLFWQDKSWKKIQEGLIGFSPFLIWILISLVYYGFLFPMPAYAKLNLSIDRMDLFVQGAFYVFNSLKNDPITLLIILAAIFYPFFKQEKKYFPLAIGMLLYLLYLLYIGGDFMSGRFFCSPFFMALCILAILIPAEQIRWGIPGLLVLFFLTKDPPILSHADYGRDPAVKLPKMDHGISNERHYYFQGTGLIASKGRKMPDLDLVETGRNLKNNQLKFYIAGNMGLVSYYGGPEKHILDPYALSDPFLAQLPNVYRPDWRPGHNARIISQLYIQSLTRGENLLDDPDLRSLYEETDLRTKAPLLAEGRMGLILKRTISGSPVSSRIQELYSMPIGLKYHWADLPAGRDTVFMLQADYGLEVSIPKNQPFKHVDLLLQGNCEYSLLFRKDTEVVSGNLLLKSDNADKYFNYKIPIADIPFDNMVLLPHTSIHGCKVATIQFRP